MLSFRSFVALCPAALLTAAAHPADLDAGPKVGNRAPAHGLEAFAGKGDPSSGQVVKKVHSSDSGRVLRTEADLPDLRGSVVMLHCFSVAGTDGVDETILLIHDLLRSNVHRGIEAISITAGEAGEEASKLAETRGIDWPLALVGPDASTPYFAPEVNGPKYLFLVGRSGEVAWRGDPVGESESFLEAVGIALKKHAAPPLDRDLVPELAGAQAAYYDGRWEQARKLAAKLDKKHGGAEDEASRRIVEDARELNRVVEEHARDLLVRARETMAKRRGLQFLEIRTAVEEGFARTQLQKDVKEIGKEAAKGLRGMHFENTEDWLEFRDEQPVLFPSRKSREGDRFAKKLEKFVRSTVNDIPSTQLARKMLEEYAGAR